MAPQTERSVRRKDVKWVNKETDALMNGVNKRGCLEIEEGERSRFKNALRRDVS
jgi:hypothetical protein